VVMDLIKKLWAKFKGYRIRIWNWKATIKY